MPIDSPPPLANDDPGNIAGISHGYAPDSAPRRPDAVPLSAIIRDAAENIEITVRSEIDLLHARGTLAGAGVKWASVWALAAVCCLTVALLALAVGLILFLAQFIGPLPGTLVVVLILTAFAAFAAYCARAHLHDVSAALKVQPPSHSNEPVEP